MARFKRIRHILLYGLILAVLVFLLKWLQWKFLIVDHSIDIYIGLIAVFFTGLGIWVSAQMTKPKTQTIVVEKEIIVRQHGPFVLDQEALKRLDLTSREYEVLQLLAKGCSNADIADRLFLSLSTIKTHVSNLFVKLNVENRTQAVNKARDLNIIE
jgi:Response regulator containing a CheY-like receiver domain and an HTH DNA-binding domain